MKKMRLAGVLTATVVMMLAGCAREPARRAVISLGKVDGRWMFISADGRPFRAYGADWINYDGFKDAKTGRSPYREANDRKFGGDRAKWADETAARLKDWGFTAMGGGHTPELAAKGIPHAGFVAINHFQRAGTNRAERSIGPKFPNVFHPDWPAFCDAQARETCAARVGDPNLIGWFFGNELHWWGSGKGVWRFGLFRDAAALPDTHTAKRALLEFCGGTTNVTDDVKTRFLELCAEKYFGTACSAIRRYDPDHLILGCRFMGWEGGAVSNVWAIASRYCDVISFNQYPKFTNGALYVRKEPFRTVLDRLNGWTGGKPLLISEWSFLARDSGLPCTTGAGHVFETQAQRAQAVARFLKEMNPHPDVIGHNFFMWLDEPAGGLAEGSTGENGNYGLVNAAGEPYGPVVDAFRAGIRQ